MTSDIRHRAARVKLFLMDVDGVAAHTYGAHPTSAYLIRPDGYVGLRTRTPDAEQVIVYLETMLAQRAHRPRSSTAPAAHAGSRP